MSHYKIAIDIGGTFTDGGMYEAESGRIWLEKSLTTPSDPGEAVSQLARALIARLKQSDAMAGDSVGDVVHATTLVTNAIIERKGARTGLIVTKGFADTLTLRREDRYELYDLDIVFPEPLVDETDIIELDARLSFKGDDISPVTNEAVSAALIEMEQRDVDAVGICLLHSYVDDRQEQTIASAIAQRTPNRPISVSSEIAREIREYERMSTTVANAYVQPLTSRYLENLKGRLSTEGVEAPLQIMVSSGGFTSAEIAAKMPVRLLESGPAAGVLSAINTANVAGINRVLAFDMGGTTAKLCVAIDARPEITNQFEAGRVRRFKKGSGLPITVPSIDMIEIGAGGGSIAHVGELGLLNVGPQSSGAEPGPACYGRDGSQPTVTDADLMLGYLDAGNFLGGRMTLSEAAAKSAIGQLADDLAMAPGEVAFGINDLVNENMAAAARVHIAEKGLDPRSFAMVATGGAGPVHAVEVAHKLGIKRVLCPVAAGNGSCLGLLIAPPRVDRSWSKPELLEYVDWQDAQQRLDASYEECVSELRRTGADPSAIDWMLSLEMRYEGQGDTIAVPFAFGPVGEVVRPVPHVNFSETYTQLYGRTLPDTAMEIVTWRLIGASPVSSASFNIGDPQQAAGRPHVASRQIFLPVERGFRDVPVHNRYALKTGSSLEGPIILQEPESTIVVARRASLTVLPDSTVSIELP
ncbi:MAG: hydantoinase/oxoprolinase family protein [Hyphomicrobiaceae bacterium]